MSVLFELHLSCFSSAKTRTLKALNFLFKLPVDSLLCLEWNKYAVRGRPFDFLVILKQYSILARVETKYSCEQVEENICSLTIYSLLDQLYCRNKRKMELPELQRLCL